MSRMESVENPPPVAARESVRTSRSTSAHVGSDAPGTSRAAQRLLRRGTRRVLPPNSRAATIESVIGEDERTRILETDMHPWRMICALELQGAGGQSAIGTGWLVGPKTIITAGHCVNHAMLGGWAQQITVRPGRDGSEEPFGSLVSSRFTTVRAWLDERDPDFDFAAIHLDEPLGERLGHFAIIDADAAQLSASEVNVSGYPGDRGNGREQWFSAKAVLHVSDRRVFYDVDTFGGQSGAPAWIYEGKDPAAEPQVVAVHAYGVGGTPTSLGIEANSAPRIAGPVFDLIKEWIEKDASGN